MNKKTEKVIENAVTKLINAIEKGANFAGKQAPDILNEIVREAKIENLSMVVISAIFLVASCFAMYELIPLSMQGNYGNVGAGLGSFIAAATGITSLIFLFIGIEQLFLLKRCPKLFLLRKLKAFVSSSEE